ncbi:hypothetical protein Pmar_PMAR016247 [Perkinsus marinus ATCC 50983]|uniref:Serine carboxypeptidase n=1 Tax=Perkinsus marinus (strain ATCC 50983 / TXsc) TaxID=423536 RepID=C5KIY6_PERM5|nr:hypothetical protein Pmar_PMAR016247 [Perkinsus marinus ATCC 50983]EER15562.1 hypothetical protein Pmar_PMAR016247 [Perkinsus marinus ATCC 50983]|eukprot:XP_002783766.1 hypothetical protein Pmar_PMAR016247 [Perkinsus marinus ATCC 50983]
MPSIWYHLAAQGGMLLHFTDLTSKFWAHLFVVGENSKALSLVRKVPHAPPRGLSKTGKVLCPTGTGEQEYGYIQADGNPTTAPTFLFINGGPGLSSMTYTLEMNGPCLMSPTSNRLVTNTMPLAKHFHEKKSTGRLSD